MHSAKLTEGCGFHGAAIREAKPGRQPLKTPNVKGVNRSADTDLAHSSSKAYR
jgi:hypothetical protein